MTSGMPVRPSRWASARVRSRSRPCRLARAFSGIASGGVLRRPHVVFANELTPDQLTAIQSSYPGSGDKTIPLTPENWETITDDMANVTQATSALRPRRDSKASTSPARPEPHR